ncbi:RNA methyltransferase [Flavobacteriaceae bacterium]|nr:RNA methyltransferase [Flavobacteriaceae bacterium]
MITKNEIKRIKSLQNKKDRKELQLFVAEGEKTVRDLLKSGWIVESIYVTESFGNADEKLISSKEMKRISSLKSSSSVLGVFRIPIQQSFSHEGRILALDGVTDPGNLGTIIRLCDWFGIATLICTLDTVDCYNPKVVQATMGSLSQVNCVYTDLVSFLEKTDKPIYGTLLGGNSVYDEPLDFEGILLLGSESHGLSEEVKAYIKHAITIPRFGTEEGAESLNVAIAAAIVLGQAFRT